MIVNLPILILAYHTMYTRNLLVLLTVLVLFSNLTLGLICEDTSRSSIWQSTTVCSDSQYCCGLYNDQCCGRSGNMDDSVAEFFSAVFAFAVVFVCCVCCYRCCCRRTASSGMVYSPASTTAVTVSLPPQQGAGNPLPYPVAPYPSQAGAPYPSQAGAPYPSQAGAPYPQQAGAPYPSQAGAPYPQQTTAPYPTPYQPQPATNPYLNMPPPPYNSVVQEGFQQAPSAPYFPN